VREWLVLPRLIMMGNYMRNNDQSVSKCGIDFFDFEDRCVCVSRDDGSFKSQYSRLQEYGAHVCVAVARDKSHSTTTSYSTT
jgi:hypothetical protein